MYCQYGQLETSKYVFGLSRYVYLPVRESVSSDETDIYICGDERMSIDSIDLWDTFKQKWVEHSKH